MRRLLVLFGDACFRVKFGPEIKFIAPFFCFIEMASAVKFNPFNFHKSKVWTCEWVGQI
ncbi:hypothetical protein CAMSH0001_0631 [Campylobacter showae RM3277]|uniref:Uncharacterized protein n=1 Tax=Campylobacter showae RM3277 TaxID=553219 RepID=C6RGH7_9BACT|nr:hypothetical protein CAMSH0001_0631 [Campylobacter showae RM3277]